MTEREYEYADDAIPEEEGAGEVPADAPDEEEETENFLGSHNGKEWVRKRQMRRIGGST